MPLFDPFLMEANPATARNPMVQGSHDALGLAAIAGLVVEGVVAGGLNVLTRRRWRGGFAAVRRFGRIWSLPC